MNQIEDRRSNQSPYLVPQVSESEGNVDQPDGSSDSLPSRNRESTQYDAPGASPSPATLSSRVGASPGKEQSPQFPEFSDYRIVREIARGGMGIVYEAEQKSLDRRVALKVLPQERTHDAIAQERFRIEARAAAGLHHTNIVPVFETTTENGVSFYTMQFIDGQSLDRVVREVSSLMRDRGTSDNSTLASLMLHSKIVERSQLTTSKGGSLKSSTSTAVTLADSQLEAHHRSSESDFSVKSQPNLDLRISQRESTEEEGDESTTSKNQLSSRSFANYCRNVARLGLQATRAIEYAHQRGVIHRDIKPSNLLLDVQGTLWIADFGLAKSDDTSLTMTGDVVGTIRYMAPERFEGKCERRSDIYSLGITLYEMLALQPAFQSSGKLSLLECIRNREPPQIGKLNPRIPLDLQTIVHKCISKDPDHRYASAQLLADDLQNFCAGRPISARRVRVVERLYRAAKRNPLTASLLVSLTLMIFVALCGSILAAVVFRRMAIEQTALTSRAEDARKLARSEAARNKQNLYYAEMALASEAARSPAGLPRLRELLEQWVSNDSDSIDRRGFEWYWLSNVAYPTLKKIAPYSERMEWNQEGSLWCSAEGQNLRIYEWPAAAEMASLECDFLVNQFCLSSQTSAVAMVSPNGNLHIWDWEVGSTTQPLTNQDETVVAASFSHDDSMLAVALRPSQSGQPGRVVVLSTTDWEAIQNLELPGDTSFYPDRTNLEFNFDDSLLAVACTHLNENGVVILETDSWRIEQLTFWNCDSVIDIAWHPNENRLASIARDSQVFSWDKRTGALAKFKTEIFMQDVAWSPRGEHVVVTGNGSTRLLEPDSLELVGHLYISNEYPVAARMHPNGRDWLVSGQEHGVALVKPSDLATLTLRNPYTSESRGGCRIAWSPDGELLAASNEPPTIIWQTLLGRHVSSEHGKEPFLGEPIGWVDAQQFAAFFRNEISILDRLGEKVQSVVENPVVDAMSRVPVAFSPDRSKLLLTGNRLYREWDLTIWDRATNRMEKILPTQDGYVHCLGAWNRSGDQVALGIGQRLVVVDIHAKRIVFEKHMGGVIAAAAWSHGGEFLAVAGKSLSIHLLSAESFEQIAEYRGHTGKVITLDWSPDDRRLASGAVDRSVRIWDTASGKSTNVFEHAAAVGAVAWSPEGQRIASLDEDGVTVIRSAAKDYWE